MSADALVAQLTAARRGWVELEPAVEGGRPARRVQVETPSQHACFAIVGSMREGDGDKLHALLARHVRGWEGWTRDCLLGAGVGGSDAAPYDARLLELWLADRPAQGQALALALLERGNAARERAASGN